MAKKKSEKKDKSKKKSEKKKGLIQKLKKEKGKKKETKKKDTGKKKKKKKEQTKNASKKEKTVKTMPDSGAVKTAPENVDPKPSSEDHSSNYNVQNAMQKLRAMKTKDELLSFTKGEKRITVNRFIQTAMNRLEG